MKRRDFLKKTLKSSLVAASAGSVAWPLSGCTTFDRLFSLERENLEDEVIIVGAGAAGLMAGFELKKKRIPFRIFEANSRVGGRIWSVEQGPDLGNVAELGAEFIEERHQIIFALSRELNFGIQEYESPQNLDPMMLFARGRWWPFRDFRRKLSQQTARIVRARLRLLPLALTKDQSSDSWMEFLDTPLARELDQGNVVDLWERQKLKVDPFLLSYLESQCLRNLGGGLSDVSGLAWLMNHERDERSSRKFRIEGGFQKLTYSLFERLDGVIPGYRVRFESPLREIQKLDGDFYRLIFDSPEGAKIYKAKYVILALPLTQLAKIKGIQGLDISATKREAILSLKTSRPLKNVVHFQEAFWRQKGDRWPANQGRFLGGPHLQTVWDSSWTGKGRGYQLTNLRVSNLSGRANRSFDFGQTVSEIGQLTSKNLRILPREIQSADWAHQAYIEGDSVVYQPGQMTRLGRSIWSPEGSGGLQWAGEYSSSLDPGTVSGALNSGRAAAQGIKDIYKFKSFS